MSQGLASSITLYDKDGNPVTVTLHDGQYTLVVANPRVEELLSQIVRLLSESNDFQREALA